MYRTADPRFRRRLHEIENTLGRANESAQSGLYLFGQNYVKPCFGSVATCVTTFVDASCPSWNLQNRDRRRRQRERERGASRAELNFDFYDDWDEDESDRLMGWGNDDVDRVVGGSGYGTLTTTQPSRSRGMSYPKVKRKMVVPPGGTEPESTVIPGHPSFLGRIFGGRTLRYKPEAAGLQEHPGTRRLGRDITEGEALLDAMDETGVGSSHRRGNRRGRSATTGSGHTTDSYSSRGDIFPSDDEDDAIPLDDEFAMVLERRTTNPTLGSTSSDAENTISQPKRGSNNSGKRPRYQSQRRISSRSEHSHRASSNRWSSSNATPAVHTPPEERETPTLSELKLEEHRIEAEEESEVERRRQEAQRLAIERGLLADSTIETSSEVKEAPPLVLHVLDPRPDEEVGENISTLPPPPPPPPPLPEIDDI